MRADAFSFKYDFHQTQVLGKWDIGLSALMQDPQVYNIYRAGNESVDLFSGRSSIVRRETYIFRPYVMRRGRNGLHRLQLGGDIQQISFEDNQAIRTLFRELPDDEQFGSIFAMYKLENKDNRVNPHRGISFTTRLERFKGFNDDDVNFTRLNSELALYFPVNVLPLSSTLAIRSGLGSNWGNYAFYQANFIGGYKQFRGLRRNRFSGKVAFYNNIDLRMSLLKVKNYLSPFEVGVLTHFDYGRVWQPGEHSEVWHNAWGGGVFFNVLDFLVLNATYSRSDIDEFGVIGTSFLF